MGSSISKRLFPRAKDLSTYGLLLEGLEEELRKLSSRRASKFAQHRQLVRCLVLYSSAAFVCLCGVMYALDGQYSRPLLVTPMVAFPLLVMLAKRAIDAMFERSLRHDDRILAKLEKQKEKMLEELIEQTNFTRTQQLIIKFQKRAQPPQQQQQQMARQPQSKGQPPTPRRSNPGSSHPSTVSPSVSTRTSSFTPPQPSLPGLLPGQPYVTPADIQRFHRTDVQRPAQRSAVDKVIDFALGDGPNNRYALICQSCFTHNGLVKEDDLDSVRYRCVMCNYINGKKLPADWKPSIHSNTIESIIQSTPTKPSAAAPQPQAEHGEDDTDSSLFFHGSTAKPSAAAAAAASLQLPTSTLLSASTSSPSTSTSSTADHAPPAHSDSTASERKEKEKRPSGAAQEGGKEERMRREKDEHKEEQPSPAVTE